MYLVGLDGVAPTGARLVSLESVDVTARVPEQCDGCPVDLGGRGGALLPDIPIFAGTGGVGTRLEGAVSLALPS